MYIEIVRFLHLLKKIVRFSDVATKKPLLLYQFLVDETVFLKCAPLILTTRNTLYSRGNHFVLHVFH